MSENRLLIVTGGNRGIGRQVALSAVDAGWRVAISYGSNRKAAEDMVAASNGRIEAFALDVAAPESVAHFLRKLKSQWGRRRRW